MHHVTPAHAILDLKKTPGLLKPGVNPDDCPGIIFSYADHQGAVGIHSFLNAELAQLAQPYNSVEQVRQKLENGYHNAGRDDLALLMNQWLDSVKVPGAP